jgi:hypothetical protein
MGKESHILIDEVVLPDVNAHWHAAMQDISMAILFGGKERSKLNGRNWSDRQGEKLLRYTLTISRYITRSSSWICIGWSWLRGKRFVQILH